MSGKFLKVTVISGVILCLGISFKPLFYNNIFCIAESAKEETPAPQPKDALPAQPEAAPVIPPAPASTYDFSDLSNWNLTVSAWEKLAEKDYDGVFAYARKCLELYEAKAKEMAATMITFSRPGREDDFAVVNDVATSHYIMGEAYMKMGNPTESLKEFKYVIATYPYAQCWDPKGWFWKVSEVSKKNIEKIEKAEKTEKASAQGGPQ